MPTWEEFVKDVEELKRKYGDHVRIATFPSPDRTAASRPSAAEDKPLDLHFDLKPKDIKAYLDRYAIQQDEAKKAKRIKKVKPDGTRGNFFIGLKLPFEFFVGLI